MVRGMSWYPVATLEQADRASPWLAASVAGTELVLARLGEAWFAAEARCTHAGCAFAEDATLEGGTIVCGCHGSEFDLRSGEVQRGPAEYPLRTYPVRVAGDWLEVEL
jgi:nitrite reductase/ring-hydroxylating ferredoxin subunit